MSCGVGCRCSSDPVLLRLCCRLAAAALIQPLAWELLCAEGAALKKKKKKFVRHKGLGKGVQAKRTYVQSLDSTAERDVLV